MCRSDRFVNCAVAGLTERSDMFMAGIIGRLWHVCPNPQNQFCSLRLAKFSPGREWTGAVRSETISCEKHS
jgi:hypothetical protein